MTTISTSTTKPNNDRHPPRKPGPNDPAPTPHLLGTVVFDLKPNSTNGTFSLDISEVGGSDTDPDRLVGETPNGDRYIRVPPGQSVQIDFLLGGNWKWKFPNGADGISLADQGHYQRYWLVDKANPKMRRLIIEPSGKAPIPSSQNDQGQNDEKFNLEVIIKQAKGKELTIEIDPITKNPPPGDGFVPVAGEPGPLL